MESITLWILSNPSRENITIWLHPNSTQEAGQFCRAVMRVGVVQQFLPTPDILAVGVCRNMTEEQQRGSQHGLIHPSLSAARLLGQFSTFLRNLWEINGFKKILGQRVGSDAAG